ncbi:MAG: TolC family protein [Gammaproteobacteria bacterium]
MKRLFTIIAVGGLLLTGCASVPSDWGRNDVSEIVSMRGINLRLDETDESDRIVRQLLEQALSPQTSVQVALLRNPDLRALYARLGLAAADVYEAGRLSNPRLSAAVLDSNQPGAMNQLTFGLSQSFTDLLLLPARSRFAKGEFERVKEMVASDILNLSLDVKDAFYRYAGASQLVKMRQAIVKATKASADLAQRFFDAGNLNRFELAFERAAASEARLSLLEAIAERTRARGEMSRLLGLAQREQWQIVSGLLQPPATDEDLDSLYKLADSSRLDLIATRRKVELQADVLGVTRKWRWLGDLEVGYETERESDGERLRGPNLVWELPIFNQHVDSITRAESQLLRAEAGLQRLVIDVGIEVYAAHAEMHQAKTRFLEIQKTLLPLREEIVARAQEQVNYMLLGVFDLLRLKQREYDTYASYLNTVRDYWLARLALERAVGTSLATAEESTGAIIDASDITTPKIVNGMDHGHMMHDTSGDENKPSPHHKHMQDQDKPESEHMNHKEHDSSPVRSEEDDPDDAQSDEAPENAHTDHGGSSNE